MRIVHLNPYHFPYMGGIEHRVHEVCRRLSPKHEMIVLTGQLPGTSADEVMDGYRVLRLPSRFINIYNPPFVSTKGVLDALNELEPDVVDFHYRWAPSYTSAMRKYEGKWVFTFHNTYGEGNGPMRAMSIANDALFCRHIRSQPIICITQFVKRDLMARGFREELLEVIPPGIDTVQKHGGEEDYLLFLGRLVPTKGLEYLVKAMTAVDGNLIIAGDGPSRAKLEKLVKSQRVEGKVKLVGRVDEEEKVKLLSNCKAFVMPSLFESYGLAAAEAMSYGKPVVASSVGGLPEVVGEGGVLVPPKDPAALAQALVRMLKDPGMRKDLGSRAAEHIKMYSWANVARDNEALYRRIVEE